MGKTSPMVGKRKRRTSEKPKRIPLDNLQWDSFIYVQQEKQQEPKRLSKWGEWIKNPDRKDHHDPFDRLIIVQAIADGIGVITSDRQFANYCRHGLNLTFNER